MKLSAHNATLKDCSQSHRHAMNTGIELNISGGCGLSVSVELEFSELIGSVGVKKRRQVPYRRWWSAERSRSTISPRKLWAAKVPLNDHKQPHIRAMNTAIELKWGGDSFSLKVVSSELSDLIGNVGVEENEKGPILKAVIGGEIRELPPRIITQTFGTRSIYIPRCSCGTNSLGTAAVLHLHIFSRWFLIIQGKYLITYLTIRISYRALLFTQRRWHFFLHKSNRPWQESIRKSHRSTIILLPRGYFLILREFTRSTKQEHGQPRHLSLILASERTQITFPWFISWEKVKNSRLSTRLTFPSGFGIEGIHPITQS